MSQFSQLKLPQLKKLAGENGLKAVYKYRKPQLIAWLEEEHPDLDVSSLLEEEEKPAEKKTARPLFTAAPEDKEAERQKTPPARRPSGRSWKHLKGNGDSRHSKLTSAEGRLEVMQDGYGFLRTMKADGSPGMDYYVPSSHIRNFSLRTGDIVNGIVGDGHDKDKYAPIIYLNSINGIGPQEYRNRKHFEELVPIYANERLKLERGKEDTSNRILDLVSPIGKGQRGLIVSPPKAGKTTILKSIAHAIEAHYPEIKLFILLIDERPEEVTDFERSVNRIRQPNDPVKTEVVASTFDQQAQNHTETAEKLMERAKRLVESGQDVMILMDSITRLSRAYNITTPPSGRTLSGGLDPVAMYPPKKFFGAARNIDGPGSLTIIATCLNETGSRMDDMIYEEFKGTGNMEVQLSRDLAEQRIFPAIDIFSSGTRRDDLLLSADETKVMDMVRQDARGRDQTAMTSQFERLIRNTKSNEEFCQLILSSGTKSLE